MLKIGPPALLSSETITVMKCLAIRHKNAGSTVAGARCESVLYDEGRARLPGAVFVRRQQTSSRTEGRVLLSGTKSAVYGVSPCCTMKAVLGFLELYLHDAPDDEDDSLSIDAASVRFGRPFCPGRSLLSTA